MQLITWTAQDMFCCISCACHSDYFTSMMKLLTGTYIPIKKRKIVGKGTHEELLKNCWRVGEEEGEKGKRKKNGLCTLPPS